MLVHLVSVLVRGPTWTVLRDDDAPVVPVDRFLAYLTDIGRSPNTVRRTPTISRITGSFVSGAWTGARPGRRTSGKFGGPQLLRQGGQAR